MKKKITSFQNPLNKILAASAFFLCISTVNAQNNSIPNSMISSKEFTIKKSDNPNLIFDQKTPYISSLSIINSKNEAVENIKITDETDTNRNIVKRKFNFSSVASGVYYVKGAETGTVVYYLTTVKD